MFQVSHKTHDLVQVRSGLATFFVRIDVTNLEPTHREFLLEGIPKHSLLCTSIEQDPRSRRSTFPMRLAPTYAELSNHLEITGIGMLTRGGVRRGHWSSLGEVS